MAEVNCQFCDKKYHIDLNALLADWPAAPAEEENTEADTQPSGQTKEGE